MGGHVEGQHTHVLGRDRQQQEDQEQMVLKRKCNRNCVYLIDCILGQPCLKTLSVKLCKDLQQHQMMRLILWKTYSLFLMRSINKCLKPELLPFIPNPTCDELSILFTQRNLLLLKATYTATVQCLQTAVSLFQADLSKDEEHWQLKLFFTGFYTSNGNLTLTTINSFKL